MIPPQVQRWLDTNAALPRATKVPLTEFIRWGNGGEDKINAGYSRSNIPGCMTAQQFGAMLGTNQGTARDVMSGRKDGDPIGFQVQSTWFITQDVAIDHLIKRMKDRL